MDTAPIPGDSAAQDAGQNAGQDGVRGPAARALTERERELLAFERQWWRYAGAKEQAIREAFDLSATRYYQLLSELIDRPEALAHDPMLVKRLRRLRESRRPRPRRPAAGLAPLIRGYGTGGPAEAGRLPAGSPGGTESDRTGTES